MNILRMLSFLEALFFLILLLFSFILQFDLFSFIGISDENIFLLIILVCYIVTVLTTFIIIHSIKRDYAWVLFSIVAPFIAPIIISFLSIDQKSMNKYYEQFAKKNVNNSCQSKFDIHDNISYNAIVYPLKLTDTTVTFGGVKNIYTDNYIFLDTVETILCYKCIKKSLKMLFLHFLFLLASGIIIILFAMLFNWLVPKSFQQISFTISTVITMLILLIGFGSSNVLIKHALRQFVNMIYLNPEKITKETVDVACLFLLRKKLIKEFDNDNYDAIITRSQYSKI